mmetsp:Transcript_73506/g.201859  ORF Transcript_73506/g.201859 Transcript_73506/m.201859 type:complete len:201 (-) Transcript_73506:653-1255(-)
MTMGHVPAALFCCLLLLAQPVRLSLSRLPRRHRARVGASHLCVWLPPRLVELLLERRGAVALLARGAARLLEGCCVPRLRGREPLGGQPLRRRLPLGRLARRLLRRGRTLLKLALLSPQRLELLREPPALAPLRLICLRCGKRLLELQLRAHARRGGAKRARAARHAKVECGAPAYAQHEPHTRRLQFEPSCHLRHGGSL